MKRFIIPLIVVLLAPAHAGMRSHGGSGSASGTGGGASGTFTPSFNTPFAANSPWNSYPVNPVLSGTVIASGTPFGSNNPAVLTTQSSGWFASLPSDPPATFTCNITDELLTRSFIISHYSASAVPGTGSDHQLNLYDTSSGTPQDYGFWLAANTGTGTWSCGQFQSYPISGSGWGSPSRPAGPRAAGITALAGMPLTWEQSLPILGHAMVLGSSQATTILGPPQYPATNTDDPVANYSGTNLHIGALLMLPPEFNVAALGTPEAQAYARTLQKYGGYLVDTSDGGTGGGFNFYGEIGSNWPNACNFSGGNCVDLIVIRNSLREVVAVDGWNDANGQPFVPQPWKTMNFLSMRGAWSLTGGNYGFFNTISSNYETPDTTVTPGTSFTNSTNHGFRDYTAAHNWQSWYQGGQTFWYNPIPGKSYTINAIGSGPGITSAFQIFKGNYVSSVYLSPSLAPGQSTTFTWPVDVTGTSATTLYVTKTPAAAASIRLEITPNFTQDYYVCGSGSDSADGLSPATAWKTVAKVNSSTFILGDTINLCGGGTFTDALVVPNSGYLSSPITFTSYGSGRATIAPSAANTPGITILNKQHVTINNINVVGQSQTTDNADGVHVENNQAGNTKLEGIQLLNMDVSLFAVNCVHIFGNNGTSGFNRWVVNHVTAHDCTGTASSGGNGNAGISVNSSPGYGLGITAPSHINGTVANSVAYNNTGAAGQSNWTGSGIAVRQCASCVIEYSVAHDNGALSNSVAGGPVGIWFADGTADTIWHNVVYNQKTGSGDGDAYDLDGGVTNSFVQYNYGINNQGPCILLYAYNDGSVTTWNNNQVSYNICQNNGSGATKGEIDIEQDSTMTNAFVFNNTLYNDGRSNCLFNVRNSMTGYVLDNILSGASANMVCSTVNTALVFNYNDYYNAGSAVAFSWNGTNYSSFAAWQAATAQEEYPPGGGSNVGLTSNPVLVSPNGGTTSGPGTAYELRTTSPMIGTGRYTNDFSYGNFLIYQPWLYDYYGNYTPSTSWSVGSYSGAGVP